MKTIGSQLRILVCLLGLLVVNNECRSQVVLKRQTTLMGSVFNFTLVEKDSISARQHMDMLIAEITRIENLISEWRPETQISEVNRNAGIKPVKVDKEVFDLTKRALDYSRMSGGAFDISMASMDRIWKFDGSMIEMPQRDAIAKSVANVGFQHITLDSANSTIYLEKPGMRIGFGSIGKGYAADRGRSLMQRAGVEAGIVNASGDMATWGQQPSGKAWKIGITNPFKKHKTVKILAINEGAVVTSGSYEKYAEIEGKRYAHIINPKTGYPVSGLTSVTVYGDSAEFANALSTSVMVLGEKEGLKLLDQFPGYRGLLISDKGRLKSF